MSVLLCPRFVDLFHNFCFVCSILSSSLFAMKKDLCDPTFLFVKTIGPEVFRGNFDCAGEQNYRSRLGVGFLRSYQSVPPNFAASLGARKRSAVKTFLKKGKEVPVPLSAPE